MLYVAVAQNPQASTYSLNLLANDISDDVRKAVTSNNAPICEVLYNLVYEIYIPVRIAFASNANSSDEILNLLLCDDCLNVRNATSKNKMLRKIKQEENTKSTFVDCPNCGGAGGIDGRCFKCGGTGYV